MKHRLILLACVGLILNSQFAILNSQELPQGYFRNPMNIDIGLSATFAEIRTNHFHAGLDIRTGGIEGHPVFAAADGYVAKVSISPWGGGKILYIKHPNGYTSVYMHLSSYEGTIGRAVLKEQYAKQSYSISKLFAPNELPVKKGQIVARSGNSGSSGGPHLHFELRQGGASDLYTHAVTINPLLFGLPYKDNINPTIRGIRIYPTGGTAFDVGANNTVDVDGPFYLGIYATDAAEGSTAKNGPDRVEVLLDGTPFFEYATERFPLDSSRMVNALVDFPYYVTTRQPYLLTRTLPGAKGPWIPTCLGDGVFRLNPGSVHRIGIRVTDIRGNVAERVVTVNVREGATPLEKASGSGEAVRYTLPFEHICDSYFVKLSAYTLYADDRLVIDGKGQTVCINPTINDIPPHQAYSLGIRGTLPGVPEEKIVVVRVTRKSGSVRHTAYKTTHTNGLHTAQVRDWGEFTLAADTTAPTVRPINFSDRKPLKTTVLKLKVGDNLAGVETYRCYLNGKWILAEYDGKTATLVIDGRGKLQAGANRLRVEVTDGTGNTTDLTWRITK